MSRSSLTTLAVTLAVLVPGAPALAANRVVADADGNPVGHITAPRDTASGGTMGARRCSVRLGRVAEPRGTKWDMKDSCAGTLTFMLRWSES
jgi:hypothetical protein